MKNSHSQLVLHGEEQFHIIQGENIVFIDGCLTLDNKSYSKGIVKLGAVDAAQSGFRWGRVSIGADVPPNTLIRTYACTSDSNIDGGCPDISDYACVSGGPDFYLNMSGRYLWLMFELLSGENCPSISRIRLHLGGDHMIDYVPLIYQSAGDFAKRFLSVFDSAVVDLEREIEHLPARFDYRKVKGAELARLAGWLKLDIPDDDDELRTLIRGAFSDYENMFTVDGIKHSVRRLTSHEPIIIEYASVDPNSQVDSELYRKLYGENPYKFFILVDESAFSGRTEIERFIQAMDGLIPAGTEFELIQLRQQIQLDSYCYLGLNSYIGGFTTISADNNATIQYDTILGA